MSATLVKKITWSPKTLKQFQTDLELPAIVVKKILSQIAANEASFNVVEQSVTHSIVQSNLNKISTTNITGIAKLFSEYISDEVHIRWVLSRLLLSCSSQPLFKRQYANIFQTMVTNSIHKEYVTALCIHSIKVALNNLYIRKDIRINTNVPQERYLQYCKAMSIKKRCVGLHGFLAVMNTHLSSIVQEQFINECIHSLIEAMYQSIFDNPEKPLSVYVECIIALVEHGTCEIVYMDEIYDASQNTSVDIRSRFLLLNVIDTYFKKINIPVPPKYT